MAKTKKTRPIRYTSREFQTIKQDLIDHIKRYYPDTFRDFSDASFGSLMVDSVSYIGDVLSFYLDYQANESFLQTAIEYNNILKLGKQMGYKSKGAPSAYGSAALYISVPISSTGLGPDTNYMPHLLKGSSFSSTSGNTYILNEDVDFSDPNNEVRVSEVDNSTGTPTKYAVKAYGEVASGDIIQETHVIGDYEDFRKITLVNKDVSEILSVVDSEGNEYYETDFLSQNLLYKAVLNSDSDTSQNTSILKPFIAVRRFTSERSGRNTVLQFGKSSNIDLPSDDIADPSNVVIDKHGKDYISDTTFDPNKIFSNDKFGIAPSNTSLRIKMRVNKTTNTNCRTGQLNKVRRARFEFNDLTLASNAAVRNNVTNSLEVDNEEPIVGDVSLPNSDELKIRIQDSFSAQNRAVTENDYKSLIYQMPSKFGSVKRVRIIQDKNSFKRNINLYVVSEDRSGNLVATNSSVKKNMKTWIQGYKMLNDTIDILDAKIVNLGIEFEAISDLESNKFELLTNAKAALSDYFSNKADIGEAFFVTDIYSELKKVEGLLDVSKVKVFQKVGGNYSDIRFNINDSMSADGRYIEMPKNVIYEIKFPSLDIKGVIK